MFKKVIVTQLGATDTHDLYDAIFPSHPAFGSTPVHCKFSVEVRPKKGSFKEKIKLVIAQFNEMSKNNHIGWIFDGYQWKK